MLTAGADNLTGTANDDTFNAAAVAPTGTEAPTLTVGDSIDGGLGNDTLKVTQSAAISVPTGVTVQNVETLTLLSGNEINVNTASGFSGLTTLNATSDSDGGSTNLTAATTTDVNSTELDLQASGTSQLVINGGKGVTVNASGTTTQATALNTSTGANAEILVGATTAAAGKVNVTNSFKGADGQTSGDVFVKGGTEVSVTQALTNTTVNETNVQGAVSVVGGSATTNVTVNQDKAATAAANVVGKTNGNVTVTDANAGSTTAAGTIQTVTLNNFAAAEVNSGALNTLNLSGTGTSVDADTLGALTTPANTALAVNVNGLTTTGAVTIDSDIKTLNIGSNTAASTVNSLVANGATTVNVAGDALLAVSANTLTALTALTDITVTNTGGFQLGGSAINTGATFTGGAGADAVSLGATTKAITMGAGDDSVTSAGAVGTGGSVDAGAGTDTIKMTTAQADGVDGSPTFNSKFTNFEVLDLTGTTSNVSVDLAGINGVNSVVARGQGAGNTLTLNGFSNGGTLTLDSDAAGATSGYTTNITNATVTGGNSFNVALSNSTATVNTFGTVTADGIETINIALTDAGKGTSTAATTDALVLVADDATTVNVTGNNGLSLTSTANTAITNFDASGVVGNGTDDTAANLSVTYTSANATATADVAIKGGAGNDNLTGNAAKDTITGGEGADAIDGKAGKDTIILTETTAATDTVTIGSGESTTANFDSITGFNAIATNGDILDLVSTSVEGAATGTNVSAATTDNTNDSITASVNAGGIITVGGTNAANVDTLNEWIEVAKIMATSEGQTTGATGYATVGFEFSGNTYVLQEKTVDAANTETTTVDAFVELVGVTGVTAISGTAAANTIDIA